MLPGDEPEYLSPIEPRSLIRHARRRLEAADADATDYRRAVSDAFYALYHALTLAAAPYMASGGDPLEPYRQLRRIRHRHVRAAAAAMGESADERVRMVAEAVHYLYLWREAADYDHLMRFPVPAWWTSSIGRTKRSGPSRRRASATPSPAASLRSRRPALDALRALPLP